MRTVVLFLLLLCTLSAIAMAAPGDVDDDTVRNEHDICPGTGAEATIVDPAANSDYAGCSCAQIESLIDTDNPCIRFFCHEEVLSITNRNYNGTPTSCPADTCVDYAYYDYPSADLPVCSEGELTPHDCTPKITERSELCGFTGPPTLSRDAQTYYLDGMEFSYDYPHKSVIGADATLTLILRWTAAGQKTFNPELLIDEGIMMPEDAYCDDLEEETFKGYCVMTWKLSTDEAGNYGYVLRTTTTTTNTFDVPFIVETETDGYNPVIGYDLIGQEVRTIDADTYAYVERIVGEARDAGQPVPSSEGLEAALRNTLDHLIVQKSLSHEEGGTKVHVVLEPLPGMILKDVAVIEDVPKGFAGLASSMRSNPAHITIKEDPLIMWHFEEVDERVEITYETDREVEVTGNTILTAGEVVEKSTAWHIIIPMLIIPLIAIILLLLPRSRR